MMTTLHRSAAIAALMAAFFGMTPAEAQSLPSTYDLRAVASGSGTVAWVPAIQNQGIFNDCWTFASATAIESNLLKNGFFGPPPPAAAPIHVSSWHLSSRNGAPESIVPVANYGNGTFDYGWGGFEYETMGYLTRGQGSWQIPNVPTAAPQNYISTMGGGAVFVSGTVNAYPAQLVTQTPPNLGSLLPAANQTPAVQTRRMVFLDQGFSNNVGLPTPIHPNGSTYDFNLGASDPQVAAVKSAILQYGAVTTSMKADYHYFSYVPSGTSALNTVEYFNPGKNPSDIDHEVTIIGWNDTQTISASGTTTTGAWLVQNSWGTSYWTNSNAADPNDGTFWASYNDPAIGRTGVAAFTMGSTGGYGQSVLQNELGPLKYASDFTASQNPLGMAIDSHTTVASILTPAEAASLVALGVATGVAGTTLQVDIFADWSSTGPVGAPLWQQSLTLGGIGYQLVDLGQPLALSASDSIVVQLTYGASQAVPVVIGNSGLASVVTGTDGLTSYPVASGLSYYQKPDGTWVDFATNLYTIGTDTSGAPWGTSADTLGGVVFLKGIVAVPEPATWVMGVGGLAWAAWAAVRRRRRQRGTWSGLTAALACLIGTGAAQAQQPVAIPLTLAENCSVIYVGVNGGQPFPYLFDTGSQIFEASQTVLAGTTLSGTLATGVVQQYEENGFVYDVVTVPSVQFYASGSASTPVLSLPATGGGYRMGSMTGIYSGSTYSGTSTPVTSPWVVPGFSVPLSGVFGAGSFTSLVSGSLGSGSIAMGSILGQSTTTGWVVSANGPSPAVTLGLDAAIRSGFASGTNAAVYDWMSGTTTFPVSGAASSLQNPVNMNLAVQSGTAAVSWSTSTLFDTGTPSNNLRPDAATFADLQGANAISTYITPSESTKYTLSVGDSLTVTGTTGGFSYAPTLAAYGSQSPYTFPVNPSTTGTATSTLGFGFFLTNSVMYDLENGRIGVTTAVVVPEPSTGAIALAGLACNALLIWRRGWC